MGNTMSALSIVTMFAFLAGFKASHLSEHEGYTFKVMMINDVYKFDNLASVATAKTVELPDFFVSSGDFLAPYAAAVFDQGRGMQNLYERIGIQATIFGNHEVDHGFEALCQRIKESNFTWISSNMDIICPGMPPLPTYHIMEAGTRRVAFVGLLSSDMSFYDPGSQPFGGATIADPIETAASMSRYLKENHSVDEVILVTHQSLEDDILLALSGSYSAILGGHDDDEDLRQVNGCWIIKGGLNAVKYGLLKLHWTSSDPAERAVVSAELKESTAHAPDPAVQRFAEKQFANAAYFGQGGIVLAQLPDVPLLTSKMVRKHQTGLATWVLSELVNATPGAEGSFMCGGNIRADKDFLQNFTYFNLVEIFPFTTNYPVLVTLSGAIIAETVRVSRSFAPVANAKFLQLDRGMIWDEARGELTHIAGAPLDPDRQYTLVVNMQLLEGLDGIDVLTEYVRAHPEALDLTQPRVEIKQRLLTHLLRKMGESMESTVAPLLGDVAAMTEVHTSATNVSDTAVLSLPNATVEANRKVETNYEGDSSILTLTEEALLQSSTL